MSAALAAAAGVTWLVVARALPSRVPADDVAAFAAAADRDPRSDTRIVSDEERHNLLQRAHVWQQPPVPVSRARFHGENLRELSCWFEVSDQGGTTPKFDCVLETGEEVRIKYGNGPEVPAETAAARLLSALGFGADEVRLVETLRCYGCPKEPFSTMKAVEVTQAEPLYERIIDYDSYEVFDWVSLERKFEAPRIETESLEGWSFFELDAIDATKGGAPRAHVDALRLMAVLLTHWDNKSENQRMVCLTDEWEEGTPCPRPFLLLQDVGATFGPTKMDLGNWEQAPIWEDRASCTVSMRELPFGGATFGQATITEAGRQFIATRLSSLSDTQLFELFTSARFGHTRGLFAPTRPVSEWVRVFKDKVRLIAEGPPCPLP